MKRIVAMALLLALLVGCSKDKDTKSAAPKTRPATINLTTGNLLEIYNGDAAKADASYKGKYLRLNGHLHKVVKLDDGRHAAILFKEFMLDPGDAGYVWLFIPDDQLEIFKQLQDGEACTLAGKCQGKQDTITGSPFEGSAVVFDEAWVDMKQVTCPNCKEKFYAVDKATRVICPNCKTELKRK